MYEDMYLNSPVLRICAVSLEMAARLDLYNATSVCSF